MARVELFSSGNVARGAVFNYIYILRYFPLELRTQLAMPISSVLAASGVVPLGDLVDPRLARSSGTGEDLERHFGGQGEQIIPVQYRKARFWFLSSKSIDKATLAKEAKWERYDRPRYLHGDMKDMVEVALENELPLEDDRVKNIAQSGEIVFSTLGVNLG